MQNERDKQAAPRREGPKDTVESIVVALILAFVFRAFVVEAFVIPTGSMAPTLYGAHGTIVCADCGSEFAYGLKAQREHRSITLVDSQASAVCPNCNHPNTNLAINDERRNPETGDRILVLKWPFDIGAEALKPARWDVVVFKDPSDGVTNFIKRLVGQPNEVLMILDGDVYTVDTADLSEATLAQLDNLRQEKFEFRIGERKGRLRDVPRVVFRELDRKLTIARKSPEAQRALWSIVFDQDFPPRDAGPNQPRWTPRSKARSGWDTSGRTIRFEDRGVDRDYIALMGKSIRASCAYNIHRRAAPAVSDLRVRFVLTPRSTDGAMQIWLSKLGRLFWATVSMDGHVQIFESKDGLGPTGSLHLSAQLEPFTVGQSIEISYENVDYRLALSVGGEEVLATSSDSDMPGYYGPDVTRLRRRRKPAPSYPPRLYADGGAFDVLHLAVDRDAHYYHNPNVRALATLPWAPRSGWGSGESPILLRGHEYFMLGDNTSASKDSRLWDAWGPHLADRGSDFQLGTVPEDQLIGKAFFVYWPSPNLVEWLDWLPVVQGRVIPDVGRMRWIR